MTITREAHVLAGPSVEVLNQICLQDRLYLLLLFPDGSRRLVPAEWTDAEPGDAAATPRRDHELVAGP